MCTPKKLDWTPRGRTAFVAVTPLRADYWVGFMSIDSLRHPGEWEVTAGGFFERRYFSTQEAAIEFCQHHFERIVESLLISENMEPVTEK